MVPDCGPVHVCCQGGIPRSGSQSGRPCGRCDSICDQIHFYSGYSQMDPIPWWMGKPNCPNPNWTRCLKLCLR
ncbi:unnamed protein product [Echinostoma caproni]|uniref:Uncharacterized protein n=1 Tax=Echinostoma caproni TaxID=27848 RepID=A0A3P8CFS0_9TREM|nr:unnamed protein product [Echinostoma caproni]